ncbi:RNA methyltransferase [Roseivirga sp. E12]|uniref:TrmH family RNA methyltransferase n=1 Tax=Roseivirga sp. E12 TaxID=2819237 RepID=UPI001ABD1193|nr:RNA methyltransferase [Roseivirga sp. E12]MBO3698310.1 RNA methyltransferase [Roseivirga sp. E12]
MLSKRLSKYFKSLQLKKYRLQERKFLVEGAKGVLEVLKSDFQVATLLATPDFLSTLDPSLRTTTNEIIECKVADLEAVGTFKSNNAAIAIVSIPEQASISIPSNELSLALDDVKDPGNLGTIIRIADWYGIKHIFCSPETADLYNPKVINATMGSFTRVSVHYANLVGLIESSGVPVFGALLDGESIRERKLAANGLLVMGSESQGISASLRPLVTDPIYIPGRGGAESLNVAVATAVMLDNFFR